MLVACFQFHQRTAGRQQPLSLVVGHAVDLHQIRGQDGGRPAAALGAVHQHRASLGHLLAHPVHALVDQLCRRHCHIQRLELDIADVVFAVELGVVLALGADVDHRVDAVVQQELVVAVVVRRAAQPQTFGDASLGCRRNLAEPVMALALFVGEANRRIKLVKCPMERIHAAVVPRFGSRGLSGPSHRMLLLRPVCAKPHGGAERAVLVSSSNPEIITPRAAGIQSQPAVRSRDVRLTCPARWPIIVAASTGESPPASNQPCQTSSSSTATFGRRTLPHRQRRPSQFAAAAFLPLAATTI